MDTYEGEVLSRLFTKIEELAASKGCTPSQLALASG